MTAIPSIQGKEQGILQIFGLLDAFGHPSRIYAPLGGFLSGPRAVVS
jgi:hypothetical protein